MSYFFAVLLLLIAAGFRLLSLTTLPPGLTNSEILDVRLTETVRLGRLEVFFDLDGQGREEAYYVMQMGSTGVVGNGSLGYRMLSIWVGMVTLAMVYTLGVRLYGPLAGLAAMTLLALMMLAVLLSRTIGPETVLPLLVTAALLALARAFPIYRRARGDTSNTAAFAALGILLGFGFYLHPVSLMLALGSMIFIIFMLIYYREAVRPRLSFIGFAILMMVIISVPYFTSSVQLPERAAANRIFGDYQSLFRSVIDGLAGVIFQGDANPANNLPSRPLIDLASGIFLIVGLLTAVRFWRESRFALPLIIGVILLPVALLATSSPNFRAFAPMLPIFALLFGLGVSVIAASFRKAAYWVLMIGLVGLLAFNIVWTGRDLFENWGHSQEVGAAFNQDQGQLAHYLDQTIGDTPTAVCNPQWNRVGARPELSQTELMLLMMNRSSANLRYVDCNTGLVFPDGGGRSQIILPEEDTLQTMHPYLRQWLLGGEIPTRSDLPENSVVMMDIQDILADSLGLFTTTAPISYAPESPGGAEQIFPEARFGGNVTLLGYEVPQEEVFHPGDSVPIITYWRVEGVIPTDLVIFNHILLDPATLIANRDTISADPVQLEERDVFVQVALVELPLSITDGEYLVSVGAYQSTSLVRLPVFDGDQPRGDRVFLDAFRVKVQSSQ